MLRRWDFRLVPSERSLEAVGKSVDLHIIGRSKVFDLFPRTYKGKNRCVLRQKHALINSRERTRIWLRTWHQSGAIEPGGRAAESAEASGADDRTGWKAEREFFFSAQNQTSQTASATHQYSGIDLSANGGGSTASALVGLGHRLEQLQPAAPVMPIQHYTDRKVLQKEREKKIALGHKADDHEDEVSYDWQQTMWRKGRVEGFRLSLSA